MKIRGSLLASLLLVLFPETSPGGRDSQYDVNLIPPSLLKGANAIVRVSRQTFDIRDQRRAVLSVTTAITVFNKEGRSWGILELWYDRFRTIEDVEGTLYDARGEEIRSLDDKDIKDYSAFADYSLYADSRVQQAQMYENAYPYTVEFKYTIEYDGSLNWPVWLARQSVDAVELSQFEVRVPVSQEIRYWCNRDSVLPRIHTDGGQKIFFWEERLLEKISSDAAGDAEDFTTIVRIAPNSFVLEDYSGSMKSWKDFGHWYYSLTRGRDGLPETAVREIRAVIEPLQDVRQKAEALYRYMQARTRYVSVQLGIGGWQPFEASWVHERGYGDCKALSNYMCALLEQAGIAGYPVLIRNGYYRYPMIPEFPSNQFNHVIVMVPLKSDTLWLECTSQSVPPGHLGSGSEDRYALMISPEGGLVIRTPRSTSEDNSLVRTAQVALGLKGEADINARSVYLGNQEDAVRRTLHSASPAEKQEWVLTGLPLAGVSLKSYAFTGVEDQLQQVSLTLSCSVGKLASVSGTRMFFKPLVLESPSSVPPEVHRLSPVRFHYAYIDRDSVSFSFPSVFAVEALPPAVKIETSFGNFVSQTIAVADTALVFSRSLEIKERVIPAEQYDEYRRFFQSVAKSDRAQVVLKHR